MWRRCFEVGAACCRQLENARQSRVCRSYHIKATIAAGIPVEEKLEASV